MGVGLSKDGKPISDPSSAAPVGVAVTADSNVTAVTTAAENVLATVDEKATKAIVSLESVGGNVPNDSTLPEVVVAATKSESAPAVVVVKDVVPSSIADVAEKSHAKVDSKISLPAVEDIPNKVPEINVESSTPHVDSKVGTKPMTELLSPGNETKKSKSSPSIGSSFISLFRRNYSEREPETTTDAFKTSSAFHDVEVMPAKNASKTNASQSSAPADVAAAIDEKIAAVTAVTVNEPSASSTAVLALDTGIETKDEAEHNPIAAEEVILPTTVIAIDKDDVIAHVKDETKDVKNDSANVKNDTIADVKDEIIAPVTASVTAPVKDDVIAPLKDEVTSQPVAKGLLSRSKSSESANCCGGRGKDLAQAVYLPVASDQNKETVTDGIEIDGGGDTDEPKRMIIDHVDEGEEKSEKLLAVSALRPTATPGSASLAPILAPVLLVPALLAAHTVASTDAKKATLSNADTTAAAAAALPVTEKGINLTTSSVELPKTSLEVDPNTASNQAATASATESVDGSSLVSVEDEDEEADIDHDEKNDVCANFEIDHHQLTRISYKAKTDWWNAETESDSR